MSIFPMLLSNLKKSLHVSLLLVLTACASTTQEYVITESSDTCLCPPPLRPGKHQNHGVLYLTWEGKESQRDIAIAAVEEWNAICHKTMIEFSDNGVPISPTTYDQPQILGLTNVAGNHPVDISFLETLDGDELKSVLAHEFGHALGLDHSSDVNDLMYKHTNPNNLHHVRPIDCQFGEMLFDFDEP